MKLEKVYDELYGMIEDLKKQIAAISGGDDVTITPALEEGTKVADYTIGDTEGSLYAPTIPPIPPGLNIGTTEAKVGTFNGADLYARNFEGTYSFTESGNPYTNWQNTGISYTDNSIDFVFSGYAYNTTGPQCVAFGEISKSGTGTVNVKVPASRSFTNVILFYTKVTEAKKTKKK